MTIIAHRCQACHHIEQAHRGECSLKWCPCPGYQAGASEAITTYRMGGHEVHTVTWPGTHWNPESKGGLGGSMLTCGCEECQQLAVQLVDA